MKCISKILVFCFLINIQINLCNSGYAFANKNQTSTVCNNKTSKEKENLKKHLTKIDVTQFLKENAISLVSFASSATCLAILGFDSLSKKEQSIGTEYVRDYFIIGLKKSNGMNDKTEVTDFISSELAKNGIYGFTVLDGSGAWTKKQTQNNWYNPSLVFFVDGRKDQSKKIDSVLKEFLNAKDPSGNGKFGQTCILHSTVPLISSNFIYKT